jgi:hypothetical protein
MRKPVAITAAALVVILLGSASQPAHADAKSEFQKGCEAGGGSYVENVDNVQCNTPSFTKITCDYKITHCTASAQVVHSRPIPASAGTLQEYMTGKSKIIAPHGWKIVKTEKAN